MIPDREMPPEQVLAEFRRWENRQRARKNTDDAITAFWMTRYWGTLGGIVNTGRYGPDSDAGSEWIEVNRIGAYVTGYQAALHDPRMKVKIGPDPQGRGNAKYVNHLVNQWILHEQTVNVTHDADQIAIMRPGVGYFVSFDETDPDVVNRISLTAVPWRELIVDHDVGTLKEQRFIARCACVPLMTARRMFRDQTIKGRPRPADMGSASFSALNDTTPSDTTVDRIVRVLSVINFKDRYYEGEADKVTGKPVPGFEPKDAQEPTSLTPAIPATTSSLGRLEWYLPDEDDSACPRKVMPFPTRDMSLRPVSPLIPLTYLNLDGCPLAGMSHVERVIDQFRETDIVRSRQATSLRKDTVQFLVPEGLLDDKAEDQVRMAVYGAFLKYKPEDLKGKDIGQLITAMPMPNMVYQHQSYQNVIDADIQGSKIQAPSQSGQISGGSATEVLDAISTGTSEIEMLRTRKRAALVKVVRAFICILGTSLGAAGGDATIKTTIDGEECEITRLDLLGDFKIEIEAGESSTQEEQRNLQAYLMFIQAWLPLAEKVGQGDEVAAVAIDELVKRAKMPAQFTSEAILKRVQTTAGKQVPNGPGAGSALPGQGSMPPVVGGEEVTPGGPQPETEQPMDNQSGIAQNGIASV